MSQPCRILIAVLAMVTHGCETIERDAAQPGINEQEAPVLERFYYYTRKATTVVYTRQQLAQLFRASANPNLDGEDAEAQMSRVVTALASVGDELFADVLSHESESVQRAVNRDVSSLWTHSGLHYPKTEALLDKFTSAN